MELEQEYAISPLFDFSDYLKTGFLSDVTLYFYTEANAPSNPQENVDYIKAHSIVLANSSVYFRSCFSDEKTAEATSRKAYLEATPMQERRLMLRVIRYLYNGKIEFEFCEIPSLLYISNYYGIKVLEQEIIATIVREIHPAQNKQPLWDLIAQCEQGNKFLDLALSTITANLILPNFNNFTPGELTKYIDTPNYIFLLQKVEGKTLQQKFQLLEDFFEQGKSEGQEHYEYDADDISHVKAYWESLGTKSGNIIGDAKKYWWFKQCIHN